MASATVGLLRAILTADTADFDTAMKRSGEAATQWSKKIKDVGDQANSVGQQLSEGLGASIGKLAAAFSIAHLADAAISSLVDFGKSAFTTSAHIVDLSQKLGLSTDAIQKYSYVAEQGGTNIDSFGQAIFKLGVNVAAGGKKTEDAIHDLGLVSSQLKGMKPEEQFDQVARALEKVTDTQERNRLGVALMGKGYSEVAAAIATYSEKVGQANIVDAARIKALDESSKAYERLKDTIAKDFTQAIGGVVLGYDNARKAGLSYVEILGHLSAGSLAHATALGLEAAAQKDLTDQWERSAHLRAAGTARDINLAAPVLDTQALADAKKVIDGLSASQREQIAAGLALGKSIEDVGTKYGVTGDAAKIYSSYTGELTKAQEKQEAAAKKLADAAEALAKHLAAVGRAMSHGGIADQMKELSAELKIAAENGGLTKESLEKYGKTIDDWLTQGYQVAATLSRTHGEWIALNTAMGMTKDTMAQIIGVSQNLVPELERQGAAAASLAANRGFFAQMAGSDAGRIAAIEAVSRPLGTGATAPASMTAPGMSFGRSLSTSVGQQLPMLAYGAITGGKAGLGNVAAGIGQNIGGAVAGQISSSVTKGLTKSIASGGMGIASMGATMAGAAASMGISLAIQGGIMGVTAVVKHKQNATKKEREAFASQLGFPDLGGLYDDLKAQGAAGAKLADIGGGMIGKQDKAANEQWMKDVQAFYADIEKKQKQITEDVGKLSTALQAFGGKAPKALQPMIDGLLKSTKLSAEMKAQLQGMTGDPSWQTMQQKAEDLGISLNALGGKFETAKIHDLAIGYARDLQMFADAGADMTGVLAGMSDELSTMYQEAVRNGVTLPDTLKPYMQQLVDMGLLLDANGQAVADLNQVAFAKVEDKALQEVVDILKEIEQLLADAIPKAADIAAGHFGDLIEKARAAYPELSNAPSATAPGTAPAPTPAPHAPWGGGWQGGTHGQYVDWGSGTAVTLHGKERVMPEGEAVSAGGGAIHITVVSTLDGKEVARNQVRHLPRTLSLAGL